MLKFEPPLMLELEAGRVIGWRQLEPVLLLVQRGRVWVTHAHEADDRFVQAGERLLLRPADKVVIEADGAAQVAFMPPPRRRAFGIRRMVQARLRAFMPPAPAASMQP